MNVCICTNISHKKINKVLEENNSVKSIRDLITHLPVCKQCGKCKKEVADLITSSVEKDK